MPSLALATGAGAAEGLDDYLKRLLLQREATRREADDAEQGRHNKASEVLTGRQIDETARTRDEATAGRIAASAAADADRNANQVRQTSVLRPIGTPVTEEEYKNEVGNGMPSGLYQQQTPFGPVHDPKMTDPNLPKTDLPTLPVQRTWTGTAEERHQRDVLNKPPKDTADQVRKYVVDGQEVEGIADRDTHKITALTGPLTGQDITQRARPYEAPQIQVVQSGDTYATVDKRAGTSRPVNGPDGQPLALATTSSTRTMTEGAEKMKGLPDYVERLASRIPDQMFGVVGSRLRELGNKAGSLEEFEALLNDGQATAGLDANAANFMSTLGLLTSGIARVHGGARGGGSIQMMQYMKGILGGVASRQMLHGRLQAAKTILRMYAEGKVPDDDLVTGDTSQPDAGGLPQVGGQFNGGTVRKVTPVPAQ